MKRGNHGKAVHRLDDGTLLGVNLGADFTAEHEWGIAGLLQTYGIDDNQEGIDRRIIRHVPKEHLLVGSVTLETRDFSERKPKSEKAKWWGLVSFRYPRELERADKFTKELVGRLELTPHRLHTELTGAWDERSFGFLTKDEGVVRELHDAIQQLDMCIGLFNGEPRNPFSRAGLGLLIASRVPQTVRDHWLESDRDRRALLEASAATGIEGRLKEAGRRFFALSPRWADKSDKDTKHPVMYWLNPMEQRENNAGWFSVEELEQWAEGKGPIIKETA